MPGYAYFKLLIFYYILDNILFLLTLQLGLGHAHGSQESRT